MGVSLSKWQLGTCNQNWGNRAMPSGSAHQQVSWRKGNGANEWLRWLIVLHKNELNGNMGGNQNQLSDNQMKPN